MSSESNSLNDPVLIKLIQTWNEGIYGRYFVNNMVTIETGANNYCLREIFVNGGGHEIHYSPISTEKLITFLKGRNIIPTKILE